MAISNSIVWFMVLSIFLQSHCLTCSINEREAKDVDWSSIRLPKNLRPSHYLVHLQPFINGNFSIFGHVEITFNVTESTDKIILHINDIITKNETAKVYPLDNTTSKISILRQEFDPKRQFYTATLGGSLVKGQTYVISLDFEGYLNNDMKGFYRSSYERADGNTVMLAATHFEPTDARLAFPCFDEPEFKAKFTIQIARQEGMGVISNMPRNTSFPMNGQQGWYWDRFHTTLPMSTYLVAFVVSDFGYLQSNGTKDNYYFRVWARKDAIPTAEYAVKLGPQVSQFFERFFDVPFPLPKQDMIALPDFSAGGMENWGLITYRESALLYDSKLTNTKDKMRIANVISHEIAHMWFGDLVSPAWWTDLWLNEGFASYIENFGVQEVEPTMKPMDLFVLNDLFPAFRLDSLDNSHSISIEVEDPNEINEIFDKITYSKGASIIRMMSSFLTEDSFRKGLKNYLTEMSYSNAKQDDLWKYLTSQAHSDGTMQSNMTVKEVMESWTLQMGFPLVTVKRNQDGTATLSQERFLLNSKDENSYTSKDSPKWWIPITFTTQENPRFEISKPSEWLTPNEDSKTISGLPNVNQWVIFNVGQTGFYRVTYDEGNWKAIDSQLQKDHTIINVVNRAQIVDDVMNLAKVGSVDYKTALNILSYIKMEKDYVPIQAALDNLEYIKDMLAYTGGYGIFKNYLLAFIVPLYQQTGFTDQTNDSFLEQLKRTEILRWTCYLGHYPCTEAAKELFSQWMKYPENKTIIPPNLKPVVYCTAIAEGNETVWHFAWQQYEKSSLATEQKELLEAMACSRSIWILSEFLNRATTPDQGIKKQMVRYIIPAIARTEIGRYVAWQFIQNQWNNIIKYFGSVNFVLNDILDSVTKNLNTDLQLEELEKFEAKNLGNFASATRSVSQALEKVKINVRWMNQYYNVIMKYLKDNNYDNII